MTPQEHNMSSKVDERISRLEATVENISSDVGRLTSLVGKLADRQSDSNKANWGWILSGISVTLFIGSLVVTRIIDRIENIHEDSDHLSEQYFNHVVDGHPRRVEERITRNDERLRAMELGSHKSTSDRFTGSDGAKLEKRVERLEQKLIYGKPE